VVTFPAISNLATQGETLDEARTMAEDCLRCYLEGLAEDGSHLPEAEASREAMREAITGKPHLRPALNAKYSRRRSTLGRLSAGLRWA
jgi:predicted RNase H-like HicB family nuclease